MSDFDPYLKWLGIREPQRPPNHYRLLGLEFLENDPEVISGAADRQMAHVRTFQLGPHGEISQRILNELSEARRCLLNAQTKKEYDADLTQQLNEQALMPPIPPMVVDSPPVTTPPLPAASLMPPPSATFPIASSESTPAGIGPSIQAGPPRKNRAKQKSLIILIAWVSGGLGALGFGYWLLNSGMLGDPPSISTHLPEVEKLRDDDPSNATDVNQTGQRENSTNAASQNEPETTNGEQPKIDVEPPIDPGTSASESNGSTQKPDTLDSDPPSLASAPWENPDWPDPPSSILNPRTEIDRVLQATRIAIGQRDFQLAAEEWNKARRRAIQLDPKIDMERESTSLFQLFSLAGETAETLKPGDTFDFLGSPVEVVSTSPNAINLRAENRVESSFDLQPETINRDLAISLILHSRQHDRAEIDTALAGDFLHYDTSGVKLPSFFDKPDPDMIDPFAPPSLDNGVVGVPPDGETPAVDSSGDSTKEKIPSAQEIADARRDIRSLYAEAYDKNMGYARMMDSVRSMAVGAASTGDPAMKYVMLTDSNDIAASFGESKVAFETLRMLGRHFEFDYWKLAHGTVSEVYKRAKSLVQINDLHRELVDLTFEAIAENQYKDAATFASKATTTAKKLNDDATYDQTVILRNDVREMEKMSERAEDARLTLQNDTENVSANLYLGDFLCLVKGEFKEGLEHWATSGNADLIRLAKLEAGVSDPPVTAELMEIADAWYEMGKNKKSLKERQSLMRSRFWYQQVVDIAEGAEQKKAEAQLASTEDLLQSTGGAGADGFFNRTWLVEVDRQQFEAVFFRNGTVLVKFGNAADRFGWQKVDEEYVFGYPVDGSIFHFQPEFNNTSVQFRKTRARDGRLLKSGTGTPVD